MTSIPKARTFYHLSKEEQDRLIHQATNTVVIHMAAGLQFFPVDSSLQSEVAKILKEFSSPVDRNRVIRERLPKEIYNLGKAMVEHQFYDERGVIIDLKETEGNA